MIAPMNGEKSNSKSYNANNVSHFADFAERVDWMTQCHSPAEIFSFFSKDEGDDTMDHMRQHDGEYEEQQQEYVTPYPLPSSCEYCGASSIKDCSPAHCERPASFFVKQRPPFLAQGERWDPKTDEVLPQSLKTSSSGLTGDDSIHDKKKHWMTEIGWRG